VRAFIKAKVDIGQEQGGRAEKKNSNLVPNSIIFYWQHFHLSFTGISTSV